MPNTYYNAPYIDPVEHSVLDHTGIPGVGGGGGGGFTDLLQLADDGSVTSVPDGVLTTLSWDPTAAGGAYYRTNGTAITWAGGSASRLTIGAGADGFYDFDASLVVSGGNAADAYGLLGFSVNGTPNTFPLSSHTSVPMGIAAVAIQGRFKRIQLVAGDYVELYAISGGDDLPVQVAQIVVTRVG
jgi:hypothetical protein